MENPNILINTPTMSKLVIAWDLDGTLFDSSHRIKFNDDGSFDLDYWIANCVEEQIFKDEALPLLELFYEFQKTGFTQIAVTARDICAADLKFFKSKNMDFKMILHRADSHDLDHVLKDQKLKEFFSANGMIPYMAYDDKEENLAIFDKYGFRTFQALYMNEKLKSSSYADIKDVKPSMFSKTP